MRDCLSLFLSRDLKNRRVICLLLNRWYWGGGNIIVGERVSVICSLASIIFKVSIGIADGISLIVVCEQSFSLYPSKTVL